MSRKKLLRITTVPISLNILLKGQFAFMKDNGLDIITASADGLEVDDLILREGVTHHVIPLTRVFSPLKDLIALFSLIRLIKRVKPDIIHTHTPKAGLIGMIAAYFCGVKIRLHTVAGLPLMQAKGLTKAILNITEKITYLCATAVYPNSKNLQDWILKNLSNKSSKFKVIGNGSSNGINSKYFEKTQSILDKSHRIRNDLNIEKNEIVFIFVGRLVNDKGINELIDAFERFDQHHLLLVGEFENERDGLSVDTKHRIANHKNIHAVGFQIDVRPYFAAGDIFVFPSYREGFPNVVLQACCMELPCIVSDINGCNEIIENNTNGLLVSKRNSKQLFEAMQILVNNEKLRLEMAARGRQKAIENFEQGYVWSELLSEYKRQLNGVS